MKKIINKRLGVIFGAISLLFIMLFFVTAFGVSTPYWDENPLKLSPGESTTISLGLQNKVGSENVTLRANLTNDGEGIASLVDKNLDYFIPFGGSTAVPLKIEVPEDFAIPGVHKIVISFIQVSSDGGGMVRVAGGFTTKIPVEIVGIEESVLFEKKKEKTNIFKNPWFWIILILLLITIAVVYFLKKRKNKIIKK